MRELSDREDQLSERKVRYESEASVKLTEEPVSMKLSACSKRNEASVNLNARVKRA